MKKKKIYLNKFLVKCIVKIRINFSIFINMSKKSISINPTFFKISGGKKKKKKTRFEKNKLKPNDIKKKLVAKIKAHQKREYDKEKQTKLEEESQFKNEFQETLAYLQEMKKRKTKQKLEKRNKTIKRGGNIQSNQAALTPNIQVDINPMKKTPDPPYGCLKGGNKPTFRQYNKTLKKNKEDIKNEYSKKPLFNLNSTYFTNDEKFETRKNKLEHIKDKFKTDNTKKKHKIQTRRRRRKITLGKIGRRVGVLVKNKRTRRIVKNEVNVLKKKTINEIKEYLRKHNLLKIGSNAPEHVIRTLYESAYLSGDVNNKNSDILLHNWKEEEI